MRLTISFTSTITTFIAALFSATFVQAAPRPDSLVGILGSNAAFQLAFTGAQLYSEKASKGWFGTLEQEKLEKEAKKDKNIYMRPAISAQDKANIKALVLEQPKTIDEIRNVGDQYVLGDIPTPYALAA